MKLRSVLWTLVSIAVGAVLIVSLISFAKVDPHVMLRQLARANRTALLRLTMLMAMHIFLSAQKWRMMDNVLRKRGDIPLSRSSLFAFTSVGVALGQVLPAMGMVVARVLGTQLRGRAVTRGTVGALVDQGSDFLIVCFLIPASIVTRIFVCGPISWMALAILMSLLALVSADGLLVVARRLAGSLASHQANASRWRRAMAELPQSGLLDANLVRKLLSLSMLRFMVLVLMAGETSRAIGATVPLWQLAASMPFVVVATTVAITPGGIGLNELTYTTGLTMFGTPLAVAAQWALANRVLTAAASFAVAGCTGVVSLLGKGQMALRRDDALNVLSDRMNGATNDA